MLYSPPKILPAAAGITLLALAAFGSNTAMAGVILNGCGGSDFGTDCSLAELVAGGSIIIDDKRFDSWSFTSVGDITTDPGLIRVDPIGSGTLDPGPGLSYTATGGAWSVTYDTVPPCDTTYGCSLRDDIRFVVSTTDGSVRIKDNRLDATPGHLDPGSASGAFIIGSIGVFENVYGPGGFDSNGDPIGSFLAEKSSVESPENGQSADPDSVTYSSPQSSVSVFTAVEIYAAPTASGGNGYSELLSFDQNFSQTAGAPATGVPEPGTFALFGVGLAGLGFARRRKAA